MFQHAAARRRLVHYKGRPSLLEGFNTQPPEGGWFICQGSAVYHHGFNTQPPEGGWQPELWRGWHSRCFNTQPPEGGWEAAEVGKWQGRCFNTQPPEGGWNNINNSIPIYNMFQHAAARRRLVLLHLQYKSNARFQHAAARRRLAKTG